MSDDRGLRHHGSQDRPGPPQAGLPRLRPAAAAVGARPRADGPRPGWRAGDGAPGPGVVPRLRSHPRRARCRAAPAPRLRRRAVGQALVAAALGSGHRRIASDLTVPAGTVRGWIRGARRSAAQLRITGIRAVLASGQDGLLAWTRTDELGGALEHLAAAALVLGRRRGLEHTSWRARINMLTRGRLLDHGPGRAEPSAPFPASACPQTAIIARNLPSVRHLTHVDRHLTHDTARIVRFSVGIVNAANIGIFSAGQQTARAPEAQARALARALVLVSAPASGLDPARPAQAARPRPACRNPAVSPKKPRSCCSAWPRRPCPRRPCPAGAARSCAWRPQSGRRSRGRCAANWTGAASTSGTAARGTPRTRSCPWKSACSRWRAPPARRA